MRADLLALTDADLVLLANRGLVKRARKDIDRGLVPNLVVEDQTVVATFADGVVTSLPPDTALADSPCSCGAHKVCRHRLGAVMAVRLGGQEQEEALLPPMDITDEHLQERLGKRLLQAAVRTRNKGYTALVRFGATPEVLLPTCTVRFLVPWQLHHARCDCDKTIDCEHVALGIWAINEACSGVGEGLVGEHKVAVGQLSEAKKGDALPRARHLALDLVNSGWGGAPEAFAERVTLLRHLLEAEQAVWVVDTLDALQDHIAIHHQASATADIGAIADALGELALRSQVGSRDPVVRLGVHGESGSGATRLDHTVLTGLGPRYQHRLGAGRLEMFFRDGQARDALVMERVYDAEPPDGPSLAKRRLVGTPLRTLASGHVTTKAATRRPNRILEIGGRTTRQTAVMPGSGKALMALAEPIGVVHRRLADQKPACLRPRLRTWQVFAVEWTEPIVVAWDPGRQTVWAQVGDGDDRAIVFAEWRPEAPGRTAALAQALTNGVRHITAECSLRGGQLWMEPLLLLDGEATIPMDLAPEAELPALDVIPMSFGEDPLEQAVEETRSLLAALAQRGVAHLTQSQVGRLQAHGSRLVALGLLDLGAQVESLVEGDRPEAWARCWARTALLGHVLARGQRL